jgi:hypothetical protein
MKAIRLAAVLSIVMTMGLVAMDTANASSIVYTKGGGRRDAVRPRGPVVVTGSSSPTTSRWPSRESSPSPI